MRYLLLILLSLPVRPVPGASQKRKPDADFQPSFNIRTAINTLFDYDAGITLGGGYQWSRNFSAAFEPTFIFYSTGHSDNNERLSPEGIKIRADVKLLLSGRRHPWPAFFMAPELHYKHVTTWKKDDFGMNLQNGQYTYVQTGLYKEVKNESGGLFKIGSIIPLPFTEDEKWFIELYSGFGVKVLKFRETDLPAGGAFLRLPQYNLIFTRGGNSRTTDVRPIIPFGVKLFFVLGKNTR